MFPIRFPLLLHIYNLATGGADQVVVNIRLIFAAALKAAASAIILTHNHPSGRLTPSNADEQITQKVVNAGKIMDILVLDHLIVCKDGYYSFADEGLL